MIYSDQTVYVSTAARYGDPEPVRVRFADVTLCLSKEAAVRLAAEIGQALCTLAPSRCPVCDWPYAADAASGCVPGNCCYRPDPGSEEGRRVVERRRQLRGEVS